MKSGWKEVRLGDIIETNVESYSSKDKWEFANYLDTSHITIGTIDSIQKFDLSKESLPSRAKRKVRSNDIVYSTVRPDQKHYGFLDQPVPNMLVSTGFTVIRAKEGICPKFVYYFLTQKTIVNYLQALAEQAVSTYPSIKASDIEELKIHLPSFEEQQSIAAILSSLDDKIELNIRMNKTLEEIAQALFHRWFVEFEFPDEQGKPYKSSGGKMVESEMGMVPEGWRVGTIGDVIDIVGGSTPSTSNPDYWEGGTNAFCTPKDLATNNSVMIFETERHITEAGIESISSKQLPVGTLLLSSRAPIGYLAIVMTPLSINQGFIAMKYNGVISNYYMLHWLLENMEEVHSRANGSTFQEISKKNFRTILFLIPITDILKEFDSLVNILYSQFSLISRENTKFIQIREVLLAKLMGGELRI